MLELCEENARGQKHWNEPRAFPQGGNTWKTLLRATVKRVILAQSRSLASTHSGYQNVLEVISAF